MRNNASIVTFLLTVVCTSFTGIAFAQTRAIVITPSTPAAAGFSAERLTRIDKLFRQYVDSGRINGAIGLIIRNGKIAYYNSFGYNKNPGDPLAKDAIFRIASQTKAITSVAVMMLYEEGKFVLDEPISAYIPEFKGQRVLDKFKKEDTTYTTVPSKRQVTIRDLLTHTSGLGYAQIGTPEATAIYAKAGIVGGIGVDNILLADKMKILGTLPLFHQPGEKWTYGLNTDVLGYLVEVISGMSLDNFFRTRIFEPLGMKDTYFYLPKEKYKRLVTLYTEDPATEKAVPMAAQFNLNGSLNRDYPATEGTYFSGGGGLSSTIYDYAVFLQMLLNNGEYNGKRILSRNSVRMMTMNQIGDINRGVNKFGLGFGIITERGSSLLPNQEGTFEWGGMFSTSYWVDPKEKIVALLYRNVYPTYWGGLSNYFKVLTYQALND